jgi:molecular chaperone Hsp33
VSVVLERDVSDLPLDDAILPFGVERLGVRGRVVRLGPALDAIVARHGYPAVVNRALGEAAALAVLLGSTVKGGGRFQLQTRTDGPISMVLVDYDSPSNMRALARFDAARVAALKSHSVAAALGAGHMAFTFDPGGDLSRYQGVVAIDGRGLEAAAHDYFLRSEQIPTRVRLAVGTTLTPAGESWRAGGLLAQYLPSAPQRMRMPDLDPGDAPPGAAPAQAFAEDDSWAEAQAHVGTVEDHELLDPTLSSERLLHRLFHERGVRVNDPTQLFDVCRCSDDGVEAMLKSFSLDDRAAMVGDDGLISVTCEFCSRKRTFAPAAIGVDRDDASAS